MEKLSPFLATPQASDVGETKLCRVVRTKIRYGEMSTVIERAETRARSP